MTQHAEIYSNFVNSKESMCSEINNLCEAIKKENSLLRDELESTKKSAQQEHDWAESQVSALTVVTAQSSALENQVKAIAKEREDTLRTLLKTEDELKSTQEQLAKRVKEAKLSSNSAPASLLQQELTVYKSRLICSVCTDRMKEVVITKCFHCFCKPCIQKNLETRHRKCPGCGERFGDNDVKPIYLT